MMDPRNVERIGIGFELVAAINCCIEALEYRNGEILITDMRPRSLVMRLSREANWVTGRWYEEVHWDCVHRSELVRELWRGRQVTEQTLSELTRAHGVLMSPYCGAPAINLELVIEWAKVRKEMEKIV